ncbi:winged helix-turn-helix transcriptional regulator [Mucilaginibacter sp. X4EP1]|uniref:winged helix-turn-helix transcriptional regulator n=1 Tax=Mucilaginibacter sp. X4EP1 TaxID=2723092 RepID=UPI0021674BC7|nr:helix-turn-helix domain-containing protein [Mucilaginibacter sp. X4EP1]MCS3811570.1 DNA-binding HxlR family transcriptional regulator [Mucilaginibacter sp. X4EP1]
MKNHSIVDSQPDKLKTGSKKFCPVNATIGVLSGKWKMRILWELQSGVKRFGQLQEAMPKITPAVLSTQLQTLTTGGIISRQIYTEIPPKVEYELTGIGRSLVAVICAMETWGIDYIENSDSSYDSECLWNDLIAN